MNPNLISFQPNSKILNLWKLLGPICLSIHQVWRSPCFGNASVLWQQRRQLCTKHKSKITAGQMCEVICFQPLPCLPCDKVSVQLIISALHPPVFPMHYRNAPESNCCIVITHKSLISQGRDSRIILIMFALLDK